MPQTPIDQARNRDDEMKPGAPPRSAHEPKGSEHSTRNAKTMTDPATGEPQNDAPAPSRADVERQDER